MVGNPPLEMAQELVPPVTGVGLGQVEGVTASSIPSKASFHLPMNGPAALGLKFEHFKSALILMNLWGLR